MTDRSRGIGAREGIMSIGSSDRTDAPFDPVEIPNALAQIARLAEAVKSEFDLIGQCLRRTIAPESLWNSLQGEG
jgi:hypothetical protein